MDKFTQAYLECVVFTECHSDNEELYKRDESDFSQTALATAAAECETFQAMHANLLEQAYAIDGYDVEQAGHDYWLTRNRHGAGFWDRGLGKVGDLLTDAAHADGSVYVYLGNDNMVHFG